MKKLKKLFITKEKISEILDIDPKTVKSLTQRGVLLVEDNECYKLEKIIPSYIRYIQDKYSAEDQELKALKKEKLRLEVDEKNGKLVEAERVEKFIASKFTEMKNRALALPMELANEIMNNPQDAEVILARAIKEMLSDLEKGETDG